MVAAYVKEARIGKGFTQKELSDLSKISVRSIQRIENGEIMPRSYTLKTLSEVLGISFEDIHATGEGQQRSRKMNTVQKAILSIGLTLFILLACWAFIAQSSGFPETQFELVALVAVLLLIITTVLFIIWRTKN